MCNLAIRLIETSVVALDQWVQFGMGLCGTIPIEKGEMRDLAESTEAMGRT